MNRRTLTWAGYNVASSVYFGVASAVLLPLYFQKLMAGFGWAIGYFGGATAAALRGFLAESVPPSSGAEARTVCAHCGAEGQTGGPDGDPAAAGGQRRAGAAPRAAPCSA
ncbi:MAG: hypothetical protein IOC82_06785 [Aestuariivirga sp.]|uniref:hypothetical protein n=1 Tax=Aestuariivirga sp. TaxID=2650926 RepID=UPI0025BEB971|nr:hypothetical protein [Aestuariivirga sp.]MCA3560720.1 hypothetical protein [Aestuariivirga sp.]